MVEQYDYMVYYGIYGTNRDGSSVEIEANSYFHSDKPVEDISCRNEEKKEYIERLRRQLESDARHKYPNIYSCTIVIKNII